MRYLGGLVCLALVTGPAAAQAKLKPDDVPTFRLRARVVTAGGRPAADRKFTFRLEGDGPTVTAAGGAWSAPLTFGRPQAEKTLKGYPALYMPGYPVVVRLVVGGVVDPTRVEAELTFDAGGGPVALGGELFGPNLGILLYREDGQPRAATMAAYNRRYWKHLEAVEIPEELRPRRFPIVDRFIGGDDDRVNWQEGITQLRRAGMSVIMLPPSAPLRELYRRAGGERTSWAVYNPPGYAFDFDPKVTPESIRRWAEEQAGPYRKAGYAPTDMALFAMSDEPGWYYPHMLKTLADSPAGLARFREYLKAQNLEPADVGTKAWDDARPVGRSGATDLPGKRRFYWSMRFFAHDSARHFAVSTKALEDAFYPGLPVFTNWNFFAGRFYVPGPVANNPDKKHPDAAMGGHDWLEFGRLRGGTLLWTEDWFGDDRASQWSYYASRLHSAARRGGVEFGAYVIPRTSRDGGAGLLQRILCPVGHGARAVKYFVFGPEYTFPGNCYSERAQVLPKMAEAHRMIGAAEDLLLAGRKPRAAVALLFPKSAQLWDPPGVSDATNANLNGATMDYLAELYDLYLALQHANIPAEFVEEEDLSPEGLKDYKGLYVTAPNVAAEHQRGIVDWVKAGGHLFTVSGAAQRDRYNEPCTVLWDAVGFHEGPRERLFIAGAAALKPIDKVALGGATIPVYGARGALKGQLNEVHRQSAAFADGSPALAETALGRGRVMHTPWLPGLSYYRAAGPKDRRPAEDARHLRNLILAGGAAFGDVSVRVQPSARVEAPVLLSEKGAAVTVLNWEGEPLPKTTLTVRVPFRVRTVESVRQGRLEFRREEGATVVDLPLGAADILLVRP